jgi:serine/threonine-protein kinase
MEPDLLAERRVGTTLRDKWTLERLLGVGGMAAVYVGVHKIGRREAIKILHLDVARSPELRARFEQEAHAVNRLKHPGAVAIHDIDVAEDGAPFLVMELLEGESLAERGQRLGGIEHGEVLRLVDELLDVLAAAHAQGIIHRDIKPDNLFVQRDGRLKVLDFGIARVRDGMRSLDTRTGATLGTTPYMAPEQIRGVDVDARVDLFAVGATMFRLVAGRHVHEAETEPMLLVKMATQPAPPLASLAPGAPPGICLVVDRAVQFDRDRRYPDALTMQRDVWALRAGGAPLHVSLYANAIDDGGLPRPKPPVEPMAVAATPPVSMATAGAAPGPMTSPAADPRSGLTVPISFAQATAGASASPKQPEVGVKTRWILAYLALVVALFALVVVVAIVRGSGGGTNPRPSAAAASGPASGPGAVDPDDPSWRPSSAKRLPTPQAAHPPRRRPSDDDE